MKTIILCGGEGMRMREETQFRPKPMAQIGGKPVLWHIMKIYAHFGFRDFILALGYKGDMIQSHFKDNHDDFNITFVNTGLESLTGDRIRSLEHLIKEDEFMLTYGDAVANVSIPALIDYYKNQRTMATLTGVRPHSRYGLLELDQNKNIVTGFRRRPRLHDYVNGGYMIFNKNFFGFLNTHTNPDLDYVLADLAEAGGLSTYKHEGFWKPMDTYKELLELREIWSEEKPWAIWEKSDEKI